MPSIVGYLGDDASTTASGVDPTTLTAAGLGTVDVIANQANPNTSTAGGVAEFELTNPTVALQGSGTADAPSLVIHLDATGQEQVRLRFNARDIDGSADNAVQQLAVQYRIGETGAWINVPGGYFADVTTGGAATQVTPVDLVLPADVANQPEVQVRILTTNAGGSDEWVGIDDIQVTSTTIVETLPTRVSVGDVTVAEGENGTTFATFTVTRTDTASAFTVDYSTLAGTASAGSDFTPASGTLTFQAGDGEPLSQTVTVEVLGDTVVEPDETFTVELANVDATVGQVVLADAAAAGTIANDDIEITRISAIQGAGTASGSAGRIVTVEAIVTADFQGGAKLGGFFIQEEDADTDGSAATSEGIFVFQGDGSFADVKVGDRVRITARVTEFQGETQLAAIDPTTPPIVTVLSSDNPLPTAATVLLPAVGTVANNAGVLIADLEAYEGMRVTFEQALTLTETFNLDRFGECRLTAGERPVQYTQENAPDQAGYQAHLAEVAARTITVDDGLRSQNPNPIAASDPSLSTADAFRMGEQVESLTGVVRFSRATSEFSLGSTNQTTYRILPTEDPVFTSETATPLNPRDAAPGDVGGTLKVGSFNVLNYFRTLNTINDTRTDDPADNTARGFDPRGANDAAEFSRQTDKLVTAILGLDADVLGLIELENDFGEDSFGNYSSGNAIAYLVDQLNAAVPGDHVVFDWVRPGQQFVGGDAIAVGYIYKPDVVQIAQGTVVSILDDTDAAAQTYLGESTLGRIFNGENTSRAALAVTFEEVATGGTFTAVVNHFKSKSGTGTGADADQLDGAGSWNLQRTLAAKALADWIGTDPTGTADDDYLILGDLNSYAQEDPIGILEEAGFENLQNRLDDAYSYVFDGQVGTLDYILANGAMADQVTGVTEWHVNADEADALDYNLDFNRNPAIFDGATPYRVSDHDPLLVGLDLVEDIEIQTVRFASDALERVAIEGTDGQSAFTFEVERVGGSRGDVTFTVQLAAGTAGSDDFAGGGALPRTITGVIAAGATSAVVSIAVSADALPELDESFTLSLTNVANSRGIATELGAESVATGTIVNDDYFARLLAGTNKADAFTDAALYSTTYQAGNGSDVVNGGDGFDILFGENGDDTLFGGAQEDTLNGGNGNDRLDGGEGNDILSGGNGEDVFVFGASAGADRITDFKVGTDLLRFDAPVAASQPVLTSEGLLIELSDGGTVLLAGLTKPVGLADLTWQV